MRRVRSAEPVAIRVPVGDQDRVRRLWVRGGARLVGWLFVLGGGGGWRGEGKGRGGGKKKLRVGAGGAGGGVVVGLGFEGGEVGGEAVFGDGAAGREGRHLVLRVRGNLE